MAFNTKLYKKGYQSDAIRGIDEPRPWNLEAEILRLVKMNMTLLDIGSGSAKKLVNIAKHIKKIMALEPSAEMRELAHETVLSHHSSNIEIVAGVADNLPFPDNSIDVVSCMLAPWNTNEVWRVLKPAGYFINETIGCEDKLEFKKEFGKDEQGEWRGQLIRFAGNSLIAKYQREVEQKFSTVTLSNGFWYTYYTPQGLLELCEQTSTIKNFNFNHDKLSFENAVKKLRTEKGIKVQQNRYLILARK